MGYFPPSGVKTNPRGQSKVRREFLGLVPAVQRLAGPVGDLGRGEQRCLVGSGISGPRAGALRPPPAHPGVQSARRAGVPAWGSLRPSSGTQPQAFLTRRLRLTSLPRPLRHGRVCRAGWLPSVSEFNSGAGQRVGSAPSAPPSSEVPEPAEPGSGAPGSAGQEERPEVSAAGD